MKNILDMHINEMAGISFACQCGKTHTFPIEHLYIGKGVLPKVLGVAAPFKGKQLFVFGDSNTYKAVGESAVSMLKDAGHKIASFFFDTGEDQMLIPDETALGRLFMEMPKDTAMIIGAGSGSLNDLGKFISLKTGIPHVILCSAPSMDGYVSDSSALTCGGMKISYQSVLPYAVIGDTQVLKNAPMRMLQAGFGDVLGKLTALADWRLSYEETGEYYCETCVLLVQKALDLVINNVEAIHQRQDAGIGYLIEALVLTGVAMALVNVSRPASGAEHLLSHYWEMEFQKKGKFAELHGIKVGVATPIIADIFEQMKDLIPPAAMALCPSREDCERMLRIMEAPVTPGEVHIDKDLFHETILNAYAVRSRYSILKFALEKGELEKIADYETKRLYG